MLAADELTSADAGGGVGAGDVAWRASLGTLLVETAARSDGTTTPTTPNNATKPVVAASPTPRPDTDRRHTELSP
ncbi:MAG TPA: hypothetical protein VMW65_16770 [Chloroflexota bacterium]|nr:hypothetical protein [Chloroflexota bacterium]